MSRPIVLGNGGLTVGLNKDGMVHDFYFPYVGLENLTTARSKPHYVGIWVDGSIHWLDSETWQKELKIEEDSLVGKSTFTSDALGITLKFTDFVDCKSDVFARELIVTNNKDETRDIRVFFHQVFEISADGRADTAMFVPDANYILDYKGKCSLLVYAQSEDGEPFDQYAVGNAGIENKEGTYRDAEDGELSMSAVEHASVDSTIRCKLEIGPETSRTIHYWVIASDNQFGLEKIHNNFINNFNSRLEATRKHWNDWLNIANPHIEHMTANFQSAIKTSLMVIKSHTDNHGGIIAACDSSIYNYGRDYYSYVWPRDGAYAIWPLIRLGYTHEPKNFFDFCRKIMHEDGYLMHKYQPDQAIGSTWHPLIHNNRRELAIQEDETASVLYMLGQYTENSGDFKYIDLHYSDFVKPMADFLSGFIDEPSGLPHPSYDLWEEKFLTTTYSTALTIAALDIAASFAEGRREQDDYNRWNKCADRIRSSFDQLYSNERDLYVKGILFDQESNETKIDSTLDISTAFALITYGSGETAKIQSTLENIENVLLNKSPSGGVGRYEQDNYFRTKSQYQGNPWFVTTLWMAQLYSILGDKTKSKELLDWTMDKRLPSGILSEQIDPETSEPIGVTPLVWSHAELINTILFNFSETK